jgi:hypothetical protein
MKIKTHITYLLLPFIAALSLNADPIVDTLYRQGFNNDSGSLQLSSHYGWELFNGSGATNATNTFNRITTFSGPVTAANVNALAPFGDNISQGFWTVLGTADQLAFTEFTIPASYTDISLSFQLNMNAASDSDWHFAIRLGSGDWYVSNDSFFNEGWAAFSVELTDTSLWLPFELTPGTFMGVTGDPAVQYSTIASNITAVGFYGEIRQETNTTHRVDDFMVTGAIPEPSTYALMFGALALAGVIIRRRFKN